MNINKIIYERKKKEPVKNKKPYREISTYIHDYINDKYRDELSGDLTTDQAKERYFVIIQQIIHEKNFFIDGYTEPQLIELIYNSMAKFDFLTPYIEGSCGNLPDNPLYYSWEEINGNRWDDIEVVYPGGYVKLEQAFESAKDCTDMIRRLALIGGLKLDISNPVGNSYIENGIRIEAAVPPCVDSDVGASFSIRRQKSCTNDKDFFLKNGTACEDEIDLVTLCLDNGISVGEAGDTGSGKTADMNYYLNATSDDLRKVTIEDTRELYGTKQVKNGKYLSRIVHLVTKESDDPQLEVTASDLLNASLRFDPNLIILGEMRGNEAKPTVDAGCTGHIVLSGVHAGGPRSAYRRITTLYMNAGTNLSEKMVLENVVEAFPIMIFKKAFKSGERKIMSIVEASLSGDSVNSEISYNQIYRYKVSGFERKNGKLVGVLGEHQKVGSISDRLAQKMFENGVALEIIKKYAREEFKPGEEIYY